MGFVRFRPFLLDPWILFGTWHLALGTSAQRILPRHKKSRIEVEGFGPAAKGLCKRPGARPAAVGQSVDAANDCA